MNLNSLLTVNIQKIGSELNADAYKLHRSKLL